MLTEHNGLISMLNESTNNFLKDFVSPTNVIWDVLLNDNSQCLYSIVRPTKSCECQCLHTTDSNILNSP